MASTCLFCRIIAGELPAEHLHADEHVFAFRDINPAAPSHVLVIPRKHLSSINDAGSEDEALLGKLLLCGKKIAAELGLDKDGFRYVINTGDHGGQTVHHIHLHVLGGRQMSWPPG